MYESTGRGFTYELLLLSFFIAPLVKSGLSHFSGLHIQIGQWILLLQLQLRFWTFEKLESAVFCDWVYLLAILDDEINCALCPWEGGNGVL